MRSRQRRSQGACAEHVPLGTLNTLCAACGGRPEQRRPPAPLPLLPLAGARARGGGAARGALHAVYLFHPVQPFLLVVLQDVETAMAERLNVFTRL